MIALTERAASEVLKTIESNATDYGFDPAKVVLRVGVRGGGCSGFSYILDLDRDQRETDEVFEQHGVRIACDPKSLLYLNGTEIDFKSDGAMMSGFTFKNPNSTSSCGCGSSFSV